MSDDILEFSRRGEVLLLGDFNARTQDRQTELMDFTEDPILVPTLHTDEYDRRSDDAHTAVTRYGRCLLDLLSTHSLIIYNGLHRWPLSARATCFPFGNAGSSVVDYVMGPPTLLPDIQSLRVSHLLPHADHAHITFSIACTHTPVTSHPTDPSPYIEIHFDHSLDQLYATNLARTITHPILDTLHTTQERWDFVHQSILTAAQESFPTTTHPSRPPPLGKVPCNGWYDDECRAMRRALRSEERTNAPTLPTTKRDYRRLTRRKKRQFLLRNEEELRSLLFSCDSKDFWKKFLRLKSRTPLTDPQVWFAYTSALYDVPNQPHLDIPDTTRPTSSDLFSVSNIQRAVARLKKGRARDHDGLQAEFVTHGIDALATILSRLFNESICTGLPPSWSANTIVPIHKSGDPMDAANYRTIMIGHTMAKIFASVLEDQINEQAEKTGARARGQAGFRRDFCTLDHIFTLRAMVEEAKSRSQRLYCCFVDFRRAFDTVPRQRILHRIQQMGYSTEIQWAIVALYEHVTGRVRTSEGITDEIRSTIGVRQGCPLSPTLFGLYIDELETFVQTLGGEGSALADTLIPILLYADDVILISSTAQGLQAHLQALHRFCEERGLQVNLAKTKVMIFNTSYPALPRHEGFTLGGEQVEIVRSYTYLGVVFSGPVFTMIPAAHDRIRRGYASLAHLERQCHQAHFQHPDTKSLLFDTLVRPAVMYGSPFWACDLGESHWRSVERIQILLFSRLIRAKPSVPHSILLAEFGATPLALEGLFQCVTYLQRITRYGDTVAGQARLPWLALRSSQALADAGVQDCWISRVRTWFQTFGLQIERLPPFQYDLQAPHLQLSRHQISQVIRADLLQLYTYHTWILPTQLPVKMATYRRHFLRISEEGFIDPPGYTGIHLSHALRISLGQLRVSSHRLEIEAARMRRTAQGGHIRREDRICRVCDMQEPETEEHFVCRCPAYYEIRGRFHCLFRDGFGPISRVIHYEDQRCLALFIREAHELRDAALRDRQRQVTYTEGQRSDTTPSETLEEPDEPDILLQPWLQRPLLFPRGCTWVQTEYRRAQLLRRGHYRRIRSRRQALLRSFRETVQRGDRPRLSQDQIELLIEGGEVDGHDFTSYFSTARTPCISSRGILSAPEDAPVYHF